MRKVICMITPDLTLRGFFHQWGLDSYETNDGIMCNWTIGIVEDSEGKIHKVLPQDMKFINFKKYCIEVTREIEEPVTLHVNWDKEAAPTKEDILQIINKEDMGFNPNYGKFEFYEV